MKKLLCMALAMIMVLSMAACGSSAPAATTAAPAATDAPAASGETPAATEAPAAPTTSVKEEIIYCQGSDLTTLDPSFSGQERTYGLYNNMYDTLVKYDSNMNIIEGLATEWKWSEDGKDLSMTLREGVLFHNGTPFTSKDVAYTLDIASEKGKLAKTYNSTECVDDTHVIIHFNTVAPAALYTMTSPDMSIVCAEAHAADPEAFKFNPVGTGPYMLKEYATGDYYTIERFDDYWGTPAPTKYITLKIVPEASQRTILLKTGEVDVAYEVPLIDIEDLVADPNYQVLSCPSMKMVFMEFNCASEGPLGNPKVRQALACAVDKDVIVDNLLYGYGTAADCFIPATANDYMETEFNTYNLDKAKELLTEAGYPDGFEFTLWTNTNQTYQEIATTIKNQLSKIGVTANVVVQDDNTSFALIEAADPSYEAILDFWQTCSGHADYSFRGCLLTGISGNYSMYSNPDYDETYYKYAGTPEGEERNELLKQLYGFLTTDTPSVVLYNEVKYVAARADLTGLQMSQIGAHYYGNAYIPE